MRRQRNGAVGRGSLKAVVRCTCCQQALPFKFVWTNMVKGVTTMAPEGVQAVLFALYSAVPPDAWTDEDAYKDDMGNEVRRINCQGCSWAIHSDAYAAVLPAEDGYCTAFHCSSCFGRRIRPDSTQPCHAIHVQVGTREIQDLLVAYRTAYVSQAADTPEADAPEGLDALTF